MDTRGDITDTFDDDSLRESIAKAETTGQWREPASTFVDPKLEKLKKQLSEPERADYAERRRRDLQRRAEADAAAKTIPAPPPPPPIPPPPIDWRETVVKHPAVEPPVEAEVDVFAQLQTKIGSEAPTDAPPQTRLSVSSHVRPVIAGFVVFLPVTFLLMTVSGARFEMLVRGFLASTAAGVCWNEFRADRVRAPMIGAAIYLLTFVTTPGSWVTTEIVAHSIAILATLIGSGVAGFLRESKTAPDRRNGSSSR